MTIRIEKDYEVISTGNSSDWVDYHVTFRMNDKCNLSCEYCLWCSGENYDYPIESVDSMFEFFKYMGYQNVLFYFHGGEPSIHPKIYDTLDHIRYKERKTGIKTTIEYQTNMSYSTERLHTILKYVDKLSVSYHYNALVESKTHRQFEKNFNWLKKYDIPIERLDIMLEDVGNLSVFYKNIRYMLEYKGIVDSEMIHGFLGYDKNPITKQKHIDFYEKYNKTEQIYKVDGVEYTTNELFSEGLDCEGCKCDTGTNDITVNADGNVYLCASALNETPTLNILDDRHYMIKLKVQTKVKTTCRYDSCSGDFYFNRIRE